MASLVVTMEHADPTLEDWTIVFTEVASPFPDTISDEEYVRSLAEGMSDSNGGGWTFKSVGQLETI